MRQPDYKVGCLDKTDNRKGNVGAAWLNEDGTISMVFDPFVVIQGGRDRLITLFPNQKDTP